MQPGAVLFFFFSPFSVFKNYCKSVHSFLFGTAARQWSSQADHMLFSHYGTQALVFPKQPLCAATASKIYLQHHQLLEVSRGERKCKKAQNQSWLGLLTEGVSFNSSLSLSPCSKNSLVTSSAT